MYKKSTNFIVALCVASLLFPLQAIPTNNQKISQDNVTATSTPKTDPTNIKKDSTQATDKSGNPEQKDSKDKNKKQKPTAWQRCKEWSKKVAIIASKCAAIYVALDFTVTAAATGTRALLYHFIKNNPSEGFHLAPDHIQKQLADNFDAMHSVSFFGRLFLPIKKRLHYTHAYTGEEVDKIFSAKFGDTAKAAYAPLLGMLIPTKMFSGEQSDLEKYFIFHETAHAKQWSSFFYRLSKVTCFLSSLSPSKLVYQQEYDAEKTTVETLHKLQNNGPVEAAINMRVNEAQRLHSSIKQGVLSEQLNQNFSLAQLVELIDPYDRGTLDTYYRIMKKSDDTDGELFKKVAEIMENRKPTTNWKEGYYECQKILPVIQSRQQLTQEIDKLKKLTLVW